MSPRPIARSEDLGRLRGEGYTIRIVGGFLVVDDVPFVDAERAVHGDGALVMPLTLAGDLTEQPSDHTARLIGGVPCDTAGRPLADIINHTNQEDLGKGLRTDCYFSAKPKSDGGRYRDFHHKVTTYVGHIAGPAQALDPDATARRNRPVADDEDGTGPFKYLDTASSRAGISALNDRLSDEKVGIIGLGGTGEYLLDAVSKSHLAEAHLFDADVFLTHNAFRAPGAPTIEQLEARPLKVDHFADIYDNMRRGLVRHPYAVDESRVEDLRGLTFVFVAIDDAEAKSPIIEFLLDAGIPFIDVGMGIDLVDDRLVGLVRTTLVTPEHNEHVRRCVATTSARPEHDDYRSNIQIAELNMLNAAYAVIAWKKYRGFYADLDKPHHIIYSVASNHTVNVECTIEAADEPASDAA